MRPAFGDSNRPKPSASGRRRETAAAVARPIRLRRRPGCIGITELLVGGHRRTIRLVRTVLLGGSRHLRCGRSNQGGAYKGKNRLFHFYLPIGRVLLRGKRASRLAPYPGDSVAGPDYHCHRHHEAASKFFDQKNFRLHIQHAAICIEHRFLHHLRQRRMREDGMHQLFLGGFEVHRDDIALN
jgi:hypothetical protein